MGIKSIVSLITTASVSVLTTLLISTEASANIPINRKVNIISGNNQCIYVDHSKVGIVPTAIQAKLSPCRGIPEQEFVFMPSSTPGWFLIRTANNTPNGQPVCLDSNGTKAGYLPEAEYTNVSPCRPIQEQLFRFHQLNTGKVGIELMASNRPATTGGQCMDINFNGIGTVPNANRVKFIGCNLHIPEQQLQVIDMTELPESIDPDFQSSPMPSIISSVALYQSNNPDLQVMEYSNQYSISTLGTQKPGITSCGTRFINANCVYYLGNLSPNKYFKSQQERDRLCRIKYGSWATEPYSVRIGFFYPVCVTKFDPRQKMI